MKEPLKDAFFQPANHPYFVKEKPFWTIDRAGAQKQPLRTESALASDSSCTIFRCESSRTGSLSLSLPSAPSSSLQLSTAHDFFSACPTEECADEAAAAVAAAPDGRRTPGAPSASGDAARFLAEQQCGTGKAGSVVINAATCPNLCRHASFLTDSLNRKNLLGGYFDADYEESILEATPGGSRQRRPRRRSDSSGSGIGRCGGSATVERPISPSESDRQLSPVRAPPAGLETAAAAVAGGRGATTATTGADGPDVCSICSSSSDGSGNAADVIRPVALKLHLADEVREDVTKLASSLTRRLFFARPKQHEDLPAAPGVTLYHRDSDRSHLNVHARSRVAEVQRSASVPRCTATGSLGAARGGPAPTSREHIRPSSQATSMTHHRSRRLESPPSRASVAPPSAGTLRPSERDMPWVTSASRSNLGGGLSADGRFSSGSSSSVAVMTAVEQLSIDDPAAQSERHERKRRRCRRRCCRAAITCAVLVVVGAVVAVVTTLHAIGLLSSNPIGYSSTRAPNTVAVTTLAPAFTTPSSKSVTITFIGALRLMMSFLPEMTDLNSTVSRNLSRLFCSAVDRIYYNNSDSLMYDPLNGCQVTNLTRGSIKMNFRVAFAAVLPESKENGSDSGDLARSIVNKLRAYIQGYNSDGLMWDKDFFEMYQERDSPVATSDGASQDSSSSSSELASAKPSASYVPNSTDRQYTDGEPTADGLDLFSSSASPFDPVLSSANSDDPTAPAVMQRSGVSSPSVVVADVTAPTAAWPLMSTRSWTDETALATARDDTTSRAQAFAMSRRFSPRTTESRAITEEAAAATAATTTTTTAVGRSTSAALRSPCYSAGSTAGVRLVADPLNCRAFYVCGSGSSVLVHMNCTSNSSYSYYNAALKTCEWCDVAKCSQCAGLRPRSKIALPVLARTSTIAPTSAFAPTTAADAAAGAANSTSGAVLQPAAAEATVTSLSTTAAAAACGDCIPWIGIDRLASVSTAATRSDAALQDRPLSVAEEHRRAPVAALLPAADLSSASRPASDNSAAECNSATATADADVALPKAHAPCRTAAAAAALPGSPAPVPAAAADASPDLPASRVVPALPPPPPGSERDAAATLETLAAERSLSDDARAAASISLLGAAETVVQATWPSTSATQPAARSACSPPTAAPPSSGAAVRLCSPAAAPIDHSVVPDPDLRWAGAALLPQPTEARQPEMTSVLGVSGQISPVATSAASYRASASAAPPPPSPSSSSSAVAAAHELATSTTTPTPTTGRSGIGASLPPRSVQQLCSVVDMGDSPLGVVVADPDDCTRFAYCFKSRWAVLWQCECGQMYDAGLQACRSCDKAVCGSCKPCPD